MKISFKIFASALVSASLFLPANSYSRDKDFLPKSLLYKKIKAEQVSKKEELVVSDEYKDKVSAIYLKFLDNKLKKNKKLESEDKIAINKIRIDEDSITQEDVKIINAEFKQINALEKELTEEPEEKNENIVFSKQKDSTKGLFAKLIPFNIRKRERTALREVDERQEDLAGLGFAVSSIVEQTEKVDISFDYFADLGSDNEDLNVEKRSFGAGPVASIKLNEDTDFKMGYQAQMKYGEADHVVKWQFIREF